VSTGPIQGGLFVANGLYALGRMAAAMAKHSIAAQAESLTAFERFRKSVEAGQ
jgi:hypothetical protein